MKIIDQIALSVCLTFCHCSLGLTQPLPPTSEATTEEKVCHRADDCGFVENDTAMHNCQVWVDVVFAMRPDYKALFEANEAQALATSCAVASTYLDKFSYSAIVVPDKLYSFEDFAPQIEKYKAEHQK